MTEKTKYVRYIENSMRSLTKGETYPVITEHKTSFVIRNDKGVTVEYYKTRFEEVIPKVAAKPERIRRLKADILEELEGYITKNRAQSAEIKDLKTVNKFQEESIARKNREVESLILCANTDSKTIQTLRQDNQKTLIEKGQLRQRNCRLSAHAEDLKRVIRILSEHI